MNELGYYLGMVMVYVGFFLLGRLTNITDDRPSISYRLRQEIREQEKNHYQQN